MAGGVSPTCGRQTSPGQEPLKEKGMEMSNDWNWNTGKRIIAEFGKWETAFDWVEEPYVSPDGEKIAAVVKTGEMEFSVCVNGQPWETTFDKIWYPRFAPDGRLTAIVSDTGAWTLALDGAAWEETFDYLWDTTWTPDGGKIVCKAQQGMKYLLVKDGAPWGESSFANIGHTAVSPDGSRLAAVVQTEEFSEGDIFKFQEGCYTVAVNGHAWERNFINAWETSFSANNQHVATEVRLSLYDYSIAVDGHTWDATYPSVWKPVFNPNDTTVSAPVKVAGAWSLACDGQPLWTNKYVQLWHHMYSPDGRRIAAIAAPKFGRWTMAVDDQPWPVTFGDFVDEAVFSPDGQRLACVGVENKQHRIVVDGQPWADGGDMAWQPVFSPDSQHVAARLAKQGQYSILVDGKPLKKTFERVWDPVFSPDSRHIMVRALEGRGADAVYTRTVLPLTEILG
jgi:hypothetical protein